MKHGDKAKAKSAKSSSKTSDKKARSGGKAPGAKAQASAPAKAAKGGKAPAKAGEDKASSQPRRPVSNSSRGASTETVSFGNPVIAAAFKRAVKKYPNAFRRLTD